MKTNIESLESRRINVRLKFDEAKSIINYLQGLSDSYKGEDVQKFQKLLTNRYAKRNDPVV